MKRDRTAGAGYQAKLPTPFALLASARRRCAREITFLPKSAQRLRRWTGLRHGVRANRALSRRSEFCFDLRQRLKARRFSACVEKNRAIGPGRTRSYGEIARELGSSRAPWVRPAAPTRFRSCAVSSRARRRRLGGFAHHEGGSTGGEALVARA